MRDRYTRRSLVHWFLLVAFGNRLHGHSSPIEKVAAAHPTRTTGVRDRRYRADAVVSFLGVTIWSRSGVGSGTVRVERGESADGVRTVALRFTAGSEPDRARGVNRLGYIQELVVERNANPVESAYFGLIARSPEMSLSQARGALTPDSKDAVPYLAAEGTASHQSSSFALYHTLLPNSYTYTNCEAVVARIRDALARSELKPAQSGSTPPGTPSSPRTFLYAVREAMASGSAKISIPFVHNGKNYRLDAQKAEDSKTGRLFASKNLPVAANKVLRLTGSVHNLAARETTPFKLWFEGDQELPIRFEYRPRSYLQLAFEWNQA